MAKPEEYIEGLELIHQLKETIEKGLEKTQNGGTLKLETFDYFLEMIDESMDVVKSHKKSEFLLKELDNLKNWLELRKDVFKRTGML